MRRYESAKKVYSAQVYEAENVRRVCGSGDVFADLVEEVAEGGGIAGLDDGGEFGEFGADGA